VADRSAAAKKAAKTLKLKRAGQKAAMTAQAPSRREESSSD
jgi:hypothetical protein